MTYLLALDFGIEQYYYINTCAGADTFKEVYDPRFATEFKTKKAALQWARTYTDWMAYIKAVPATEAIDDYKKWVEEGTIRRVLSKIDLTQSRPYNGESPQEVLDWWLWYKYHDEQVKYTDFETWPHLYDIFQHLWTFAHFLQDATITVEIYTAEDGDFDTFKNELDLVIDKVTYTNDDFLVFPIFDHYCGTNGNFAKLLYNPKTDAAMVTDDRFNEYAAGTLKDAFEYMKKERYYNR